MIDSIVKELRVGNLILLNGKESRVENVSEFYVNRTFYEGGHGDGGTTIDDYNEYQGTIQGVKITNERLPKFGFQKDSDGVFKRDCLYWLDNGVLQIAIGYTPVLNAPCEYIHQLQNLIFTLEGKEL